MDTLALVLSKKLTVYICTGYNKCVASDCDDAKHGINILSTRQKRDKRDIVIATNAKKTNVVSLADYFSVLQYSSNTKTLTSSPMTKKSTNSLQKSVISKVKIQNQKIGSGPISNSRFQKVLEE